MLVFFMAHLVSDLADKTATDMNILMWTISQQELEFQITSCLLMKRSMDSANVVQKRLYRPLAVPGSSLMKR